MTAEQRSRVLVTGGSGFIGRRLVRALLGTGAEVTVADHLARWERGDPTAAAPHLTAMGRRWTGLGDGQNLVIEWPSLRVLAPLQVD